MQNIIRSKLLIKRGKISSLSKIKSSTFSTGILNNKNNFKRDFQILKKDRQRFIFIKYTKLNFSNKEGQGSQEGAKDSENNKQGEEKTKGEEQTNQENQDENNKQQENENE